MPEGEMPEMCDESDENCEMPEPPEGFDGEMSSDMQGMRGGFQGEMTMASGSSDSVLHPVAYLSLGAGSLALALVIAYACFSGFFRKKPGKTFNALGKFIWFVATAVVLAAGLITLCYFVPIWVK